MTHEIRAGSEAEHGPEHDDNLPDADDVPVHDDPAESDADPLDDEEPGAFPTWAGTERSEV